MRLQAIGFAFITSLLAVTQAQAYAYSSATVSANQAIQLKGNDGASIALVSGRASIDIESYGFFSGDGTLKITSAQGTIEMTIPRNTFESGWKFFSPANTIGQSVSLRGGSSQSVTTSPARQATVPCDIQPYELPIAFNDGRPVTYDYVDQMSHQTKRAQLTVRLCAQTVEGKTIVKQVGQFQSCSGMQTVSLQTQTTTEVFTIEFLNPSTSQLVGTIVANGESSQSEIRNALTACQ